jgi:hypothetical protein
MNRSTLTACFLLSVLAGGCGAEPAPESPEPLGEVPQAAEFPPICTLKFDYRVRYYSDSSKTTKIGTALCSCGYLYLEGNSSSYTTYNSFLSCTTDPL